MFARKKKQIGTHFTSSQEPKNVQLSSQQEASQRFCHLQKQQRCHAIGFSVDQWERSIGGECCEKGKWSCKFEGEKKRNGSLASLPDVSTFCVRARMDKRRLCQWESEHVWKMFAPTFSSAAQGGLLPLPGGVQLCPARTHTPAGNPPQSVFLCSPAPPQKLIFHMFGQRD